MSSNNQTLEHRYSALSQVALRFATGKLMAEQKTTPAGLLTPDQVRKISADAEAKELQATLALARKSDEEHKKLHEAFMSREVHPDAMARVMAVVRRAAEQGKSEILLFEFPSDYCTDGGRAINNTEPDWPRSLDGFARRAYDAYEKQLKPHGYKLQARVLDYPKGIPGNVGLFLSW
jgi:hypothetical protein